MRTKSRPCRIVIGLFGLLYLVALALMVIGTYGLFGSEPGPLAGVFLIPLGLPWILLANGVADSAGPRLAVLAPLLNLAILWAICRALAARRRR